MVTRRITSQNNSKQLIIGIIVILGVGAITFGILAASGFFGTSTAKKQRQKKSREGLVPVPKTLKALKAFEKVTREDIYNLTLGEDSFFWLPKAQVEANPQWKTSVSQIVGRVMARDKKEDFVFKESDFLPEGSRTGLMGGVPEGKQGFFLDVDKIPGLRFLKQGDRFDLLVNLPSESENSTAEYGLLMGGIKAQGGRPIPVNGIRVLVQRAELVALTTNQIMTTQGGLSLNNKDKNGRPIRAEKEERVLIAISPKESVPLTDALGNELQIHLIVQSGQKEVEDDSAKILEGMVAFAANATKIEPFTKITAKDLAEPTNGELRQYYFRPEDVKDSWIPKAEDLIGKTVAREIEPGYIFSQADFLPQEHLVKDVEAFSTIAATDLVDGENSTWIGSVAARELKAGQKLDQSSILEDGSLLRDVSAMSVLSREDLVGGQRSPYIGKVARVDLKAGHNITDENLLPENSLLKDVEAFQLLKASDLVGGFKSRWIGRVAAIKLQAGQLVEDSMILAAGSRPGISGAIPKGKLAISVPIKANIGMERLESGDRIDLIESVNFDLAQKLSGVAVSSRLQSAIGASVINKVIAEDVVVIDRDDEQVILAVAVGEVSSVTKAMSAGKNKITAVTRPGVTKTQSNSINDPPKNNGSQTRLESDQNPLDSIIVTKMIIDGKKTEMAFRREKNE